MYKYNPSRTKAPLAPINKGGKKLEIEAELNTVRGMTSREIAVYLQQCTEGVHRDKVSERNKNLVKDLLDYWTCEYYDGEKWREWRDNDILATDIGQREYRQRLQIFKREQLTLF